jgi:hypothetical protein
MALRGAQSLRLPAAACKKAAASRGSGTKVLLCASLGERGALLRCFHRKKTTVGLHAGGTAGLD